MKDMSEIIFISIPHRELFFDIVRVCEYTVSVYAYIATLKIHFFIKDFELEFITLFLMIFSISVALNSIVSPISFVAILKDFAPKGMIPGNVFTIFSPLSEMISHFET